MTVLGIIPARGGSKSIPHKNLALLRGRPLIAYTFEAARQSSRLDHVVLSTDDNEIAEVAKDFRVDVPFLRPAELSLDDTPMVAVVKHAVSWAVRQMEWDPQIIVLLQPTSPLRRANDIDTAVDLLKSGNADTVVSVVEVPHQFTPSSLMEIKNGLLQFVSTEPQILRRQDKPRLYARNGPAVLAVRRSVMERGALYGDKILPLLMPRERSIDIDDPADLAVAEFWLDRSLAH